MQELVQIEDHGLSLPVELAEKFIKLYYHMISASSLDKMDQYIKIHGFGYLSGIVQKL